MNEKLYTVVGTAVNPDGTVKIRWANDLATRLKVLIKAGCTDIELYETPEPMTKLDAVQWLYENKTLSADAREIAAYKIVEKEKLQARNEAKVTLTNKIEAAVKTNSETDPRISAFIEKTLASSE